MIDPSLTRRRRPNPSKKLKLVCSFNGTFQPRPPSGKLRYTGGETRIVSVDRNIGFSRLKSKISDLVCPKNSLSFSLKYHIPDSGSIGECTPLVLITSDDDVRYMIDEYEKLELSGKRTRLWLYVCNDNEFFNSYSVNETEKLSNGFGVLCKNNGNFVREVSDSLSGNCFETRNLTSQLCGEKFDSDKVKNYCDDSSRKLVLKQQLLAKKPSQIQIFQSGLGFPVEQTKVELTTESQKYDRPLIDLTSEPECPVTHEPTNPNFGSSPCRLNMLDYEFPKTHSARSENLCNSHSHLLNSKGKRGIVHLGTNTFTQSLSGQTGFTFGYGTGTVSGISCQFAVSSQLPKQPFKSSVNLMPTGSDDKYKSSDLTKENIMPWYANSNSVKTRFAPVSYSNQSVGNTHPLKSSYGGIHNRRFGVNDTRNQRTCPYYFRNQSSCNFTGMCDYQNARLDGRHSVGKFYPGVWSSSNISKQAQATRLYYPGLWKHWSGYNDQPCDSKENLKDKGGIGVPPHGTAMADPSPLPLNAMKDLLTGSNGDKHEVLDQATCKNFHGELKNVQPICLDMIKQPLMDLNLCNLSLSSGKEVDSRDNSSPVSENASEALLKPKSKLSDLMDEEYLSLGLHVKKPNGVKSNSSSRKAAKLEDDGEEKEEIQQDPRSTLSFDEKGDNRVSHKCSKADGRVSNDLASFYTHLATRELQTIKASDLEYIKELGSGTYGTVFFGKWKGSDVAIKRLKPSCFTEGSVEENRLVADFWKEAHILGQLHHPNIVALYGVVTDGPVTNLATVTEYMVNGSLKQVLQKKDRTIDRRKRLIIAMDAAFGMEYLHEKNIVHFDLKSHNFLVNMRDPQRPMCKIGDLGLSKIKQRTLVSGGVRGTIPWMAPELLSSKNNMVTEKVDVYSFGIVMWELLTGEEPYGKLRSEEIIAGIIKGNLRPEIPSWCDPTWRSLMERCWSSDPDSRPAFSEIAKELRAISASMNIK